MDLPPDAYATTDLPGATAYAAALPRTGHVDSYSPTWQGGYTRPDSTADATPFWYSEWCPVGDGLAPTNPAASAPDLAGTANILRLPSRDGAAIKAQIANLVAVGATSINAGLRWGIGLLDPSAQGVFADLILRGRMSDALADHPLPYDTPSLAKVVVLMTDGEHFPEQRLNPDYRDGPSPIYLSRDGEFSIFHSSRSQTAKYWVPALGLWQTAPYRGSSAEAPQQLTWPEVWARLRMSYVAYQFYTRPLGRSLDAQMNLFRSQTDTATMDRQLLSACTLAKTKGVVIYTVAFDAPSHGAALLQSCATSAGYAYTAGQGDLAQVFAGIAANIRQLRLTQ
ncbi:MAG: hypothetical protein EBU97_04985 [Rhodobacteraceae bacterium]|nr:hypothetical protein [Paracoccaceae bacterium]